MRKCIRYVRARPIFDHSLITLLPKLKIRNSQSFAKTDIDFAGPFIVQSEVRRIIGKKTWLAVFVCFTKAVHLEVVEDTSSAAFLACLKRFIFCRNQCAVIYSDNETNFVGSQKELSIFINKDGSAMAKEGINGVLIHFQVHSSEIIGKRQLMKDVTRHTSKNHFKCVMGETNLTLTELNTLVC